MASGWQGHLRIDYRQEGGHTTALDRHHGPLRVLQRLYPEGPAICHHVLVHPPGGIVGGDTLEVALDLAPGSHALLTTPGATRFYRSEGAPAVQRLDARVQAGARLEWLPLETLAYSGCIAENHFRFTLEEGAEMIGWDLLALGLPTAQAPFERGSVLQHLEVPGAWLEHGRLAADDKLLLDSPLGFAGRRVVATVWWASGAPMGRAQRERLLETARDCFEADTFRRGPEPAERAVAQPDAALVAGATSPDGRVVLCRVLAHRVEPAFALCRAVRAAWRREGWGLPPAPPRIWRT